MKLDLAAARLGGGKPMTVCSVRLLVVVLTLAACTPAPEAPPAVDESPPVEDIVTESSVAPEAARLLLETPWATVTEISLEPGGRLTFHRGGERVAYALSDHTLRFIPEPGAGGGGERPSTAGFRAGWVGRHPSGTYTVENPGPGPARALVVNRSSEPLPATSGVEPKFAEAAGGQAEILLDDAVFAVRRVTLAPGTRVPRHRCEPQVVYALGPDPVKLRSGGSELPEVVLEAGDARWVPAGECALESLGGGAVRYLVFSFRR